MNCHNSSRSGNWKKHVNLKGKQQKKIQYYLRPLQRGEYYFGNIHLFITSPVRVG